jgi:DNA polymerase-1
VGSVKPLLLIDGDHVLYRSLTAAEHEANWGNGIWTLHIQEDEAWMRIQRNLQALVKYTKLSDPEVILCFGSGRSFRRALDPGYKAWRRDEDTGKRIPMRYSAMRRRLIEGDGGYKTQHWSGLEGDDVIGILATYPPNVERVVIASEDKDLMQIPGRNWRQGTMTTITEAEADYWFLYQTLIGDVVDGFKGCPGVGPKKAEKILAVPTWASIVSAFRQAGLTEQEALLQARLARIIRWSDWDPERKEPKLWMPMGGMLLTA